MITEYFGLLEVFDFPWDWAGFFARKDAASKPFCSCSQEIIFFLGCHRYGGVSYSATPLEFGNLEGYLGAPIAAGVALQRSTAWAFSTRGYGLDGLTRRTLVF